jgi:5-methylthioribose kinase
MTITNEEMEKIKAFREWCQTDIGKAFLKFENTTARYWQMDNSETISDRRLSELDNAMKEARKEFLAFLPDYPL